MHTLWRRRTAGALTRFAILIAAGAVSAAQEPLVLFGGAYTSLDPQRQKYVDDWTTRFTAVTGRRLEPALFYDEFLPLSTRTTFEAITHALRTTALTDRTGANLGDALSIVERVESVRGEVPGAPGDRQFRLYARLTADAIDRLSRSQQFKRGIDNFAYHKGYPRNYRGRGGVPSIQFSIALDGRRADVDVDYRGSSFPVSLFNGHLTAANSDVRAGNNFDRHADRWTGFQNWWRSFFGVREQRAPQEADRPSALALPPTPRAGNKTIDAMTQDFLQAWLIEGDIVAAMGYVSERSYACLAQEAENPGSFDRGTAPYQLMMNLKSAHDTLGAHASLESLVVGTRLTVPGLRVVTQPYHAQFVIYSVPDDVAAAFDCESRLTPAAAAKVERAYGTYFGTTFFIDGERDYSVALLWAKDQGYWKIVSWRTAENGDPAPAPPPVREPRPARIGADRTLVDAARAFLDAWLVRRQYDTALTYVSPKTNGCYNLERGPDSAPATSSEDARQKIRAGFETIAEAMAANTTLEAMIAAPEPAHPLVRVMSHRYDRVFGLTGLPSALADAVECDAREQDLGVPDPLPLEYGKAFGMTMRFKMRSGDAPILRLLWRREPEGWRITSYDVELP